MSVSEELVGLEAHVRRLRSMLATAKAQAVDLASKRLKAQEKLRHAESVFRQGEEHYDGILKQNPISLEGYVKAREIMGELDDRRLTAANELAVVDSAIARNLKEVPAIEKMMAAAAAQLSKWGTLIPFERASNG